MPFAMSMPMSMPSFYTHTYACAHAYACAYIFTLLCLCPYPYPIFIRHRHEPRLQTPSCDVIVFDNRGIGESTVASYFEPITIELMAQDTIELVKHLGIKRFNLFGGSMGGRIALCVAFEHSIRS